MSRHLRLPSTPPGSLQPSRRRGRVVRSLLAVAALVLALVAPQAILSPAFGTSPAPTSITAVASTDPSLPSLAGAPGAAVPSVLTSPSTPFQVTVSLWIGSTPASYNKDMVVTLTAPGPGHLSVGQVTIPAGATSVTVLTAYSTATSSVQVTASVGSKNSLLTATTASFSVQKNLNFLSGSDGSLKNGTAGADGSGCAVVDKAHPVCGIINLPNGATGNVALSLGVCPSGQPCASGATVTQLVANLNDANGAPLYTRTSPASMTIVCDKSLCGNGGVSKFNALWSLSATGDLAVVPPCPSKGVIGATQNYCTDYVSSTRDNAGDLLLVVLFLQDMRGTI